MTAVIIIALIAFVAIVFFSIQYPSFLEAFSTYEAALVFYMGQAMDIVWLFVPKAIFLPCMTLAVSVEILTRSLDITKWVVEKIPWLHR